MFSIDFWKKVIFANLVTYEVLHGQRRYSVSYTLATLRPRLDSNDELHDFEVL